MTTERLWEEFQHYTRDLTEHSRKLAFAAAAICWFFKTPQITFPPPVMWSLSLLVCFFILDVLHYFVGAVILRWFTEREEARLWKETGSISGDIAKPRWVDVPAWLFFIAKTLVLLASFAALATEFYFRLRV